jgi:hypothetical protein
MTEQGRTTAICHKEKRWNLILVLERRNNSPEEGERSLFRQMEEQKQKLRIMKSCMFSNVENFSMLGTWKSLFSDYRENILVLL